MNLCSLATLENINSALLICFSILFLLKIYEFLRGMIWALRYGSNYADEIIAAINRWNENGFDREDFTKINEQNKRIWSASKWSISQFFWKFPSPYKETFVNLIFRLPTLVIGLTVTIGLSSNKILLIVGIALLLFGLWLVTIHHIIYRLTFGYTDNYFSRTVSIRLIPYPDPQPNELNPSRRKLIKEFAKVFVWLLFLVVIGYTGIYIGLDNYLTPNNAFTGIHKGWTLPLELLYFSIVTLATVGFGDINPNPDEIFVRLAVASQIMVGFFLVVFLLTSFSLTIEPETVKNQEK